ncbi:hypothetical protein [Ensifer sp. B1-9]|uniref:hypothetical protein n=1 Tax=Ensifer sp. B1-9 TaxID=3141455 RepID=UPI003D1B8237
MSRTREWNRSDAEKDIADVLNDAKTGALQLIKDVGGTFELRFIKDPGSKRSTAEFLARGGPSDDETT